MGEVGEGCATGMAGFYPAQAMIGLEEWKPHTTATASRDEFGAHTIKKLNDLVFEGCQEAERTPLELGRLARKGQEEALAALHALAQRRRRNALVALIRIEALPEGLRKEAQDQNLYCELVD